MSLLLMHVYDLFFSIFEVWKPENWTIGRELTDRGSLIVTDCREGEQLSCLSFNPVEYLEQSC